MNIFLQLFQLSHSQKKKIMAFFTPKNIMIEINK